MDEAKAIYRAWLRQARADFNAARSEAISPAHQRYFLQQACEKAIKALGLSLWREAASDPAFRKLFLHRHSPLVSLATEPNVPKSIWLLRRQLLTELSALDGADIVQRIDGTTPTTNPTEVSYRYPFVDALTSAWVAPSDWSDARWDSYQGSRDGAVAAIERFLRRLHDRPKRLRGPH